MNLKRRSITGFSYIADFIQWCKFNRNFYIVSPWHGDNVGLYEVKKLWIVELNYKDYVSFQIENGILKQNEV